VSYTLLINKNNKHHEVHSPSPEEIEGVIDSLIPVPYHYLILFSNDKLNHYIQTVATSDGSEKEIEYLVEIRFEYGKRPGENFDQYQYTTYNINILKRMFRMYALDVNPDISDWTDITEKIKNLPDIETQRAQLEEK